MDIRTRYAAPLLLLMSTTAAVAQGPGQPVEIDGLWQGPYFGINVGGGFGNTTATNNLTGFTSNQKLNFGGVAGGIQGGYNWRLGPSWLVGLEADFMGTDFNSNSGTHVFNSTTGASFSGSVSRSQDFLGTVRGRIGYNITPGWLWDFSGGFAYGQVNSSASASVTGLTVPGLTGPQSASFQGSKSGVQTGWAVGSGSEIALSPQLGLVFQYLHTDLGNFTYNPAIRTATGAAVVAYAKNNITINNNSNILRIGLNYHFNVPPPPVPVAAPMPPPPPPPPPRREFMVFFDWDKANITPEGMQVVHQAADAYKAGGSVRLTVTGYTDLSGSPAYNLRLSQRRANTVAEALSGMGVSRSDMAVSGQGENNPRVPTAQGVREPQNRRVEILFP